MPSTGRSIRVLVAAGRVESISHCVGVNSCHGPMIPLTGIFVNSAASCEGERLLGSQIIVFRYSIP